MRPTIFPSFVLHLFFLLLSLNAAAQIINTVAGSRVPVEGGNPLHTALNYPNGVTMDATGNTYIADYQNHRIRKIGTDGTIVTVAGTGVPGYNGDNILAVNAQLYSPYGITVDGHGDLYIADLNNNRIRKVTAATGIITTIAGTGTYGYNGDNINAANAQLALPTNTAVDAQDNIFVVDFFNQRIRKISGGIITTVAGTGTAGYNQDNIPAIQAQISYPYGIALDAHGDGFFIADVGNNRIRKVNAAGTITTIAGTGAAGFSGDGGPAANAMLNAPYSVTVDGANAIYFSDNGNHRIRLITQSGQISTLAGTGTAGYNGEGLAPSATEFNEPTGLCIDNNLNITVADSRNNRIRRFFAFGGTVSTIAGNGLKDYYGDGGPAMDAGFIQPIGVFRDKKNNIFIADGAANKVRKIDPAGIISTIAGTGVAGSSGDNGAAVNAAINNPYGIYADNAGNVYIGTLGDFRIRRIDTSGIITTFAGTGTDGYSGDNGPATSAAIGTAQGITGDAQDNIYFADFMHGVVRKVNAVTHIITTVAGTGTQGYSGDGGSAVSAQLGSPNSVSFDGAGNMYIGDDFPNVVRKVSGGIISTVAGGLDVNGDGIYNSMDIGDAGDNGPATAAAFTDIECAYADSAGNIFIADAGVHKVRKVDAGGLITTLAGTGVAGSSADSIPASTAAINSPWAVTTDRYGDVYIADNINKRIRKITMPDMPLRNGNWSDASIWARGKVPDALTVITIPKQILVDITAACWTLFLFPPGNITVGPGQHLEIAGH